MIRCDCKPEDQEKEQGRKNNRKKNKQRLYADQLNTLFQNVHIDTHYIEWKSGLKLGRKGRPVRLEPLQCEWTGRGPFIFRWWCIRYIKRFYDRIVSVVVVSRGTISVQGDATGKLTDTTRPLAV